MTASTRSSPEPPRRRPGSSSARRPRSSSTSRGTHYRTAAAVESERACLALITTVQRLDFLEDFAQDAEEGRTGTSDETLARHGLTTKDLRPEAAGTAPVAELIAAQASTAAASLAAAQPIIGLAAAPYRPFLQAVLQVQETREAAARKAGAPLVPRPCRPSPLRCGAALLRKIALHSFAVLEDRRSAARLTGGHCCPHPRNVPSPGNIMPGMCSCSLLV
ncbi:squalene/phytoene synthase family protein [Streptomyces vietnamensis]|uniref:squalene/phytoene synthase family protein n=1 Tax=Streptomyces vietnamensis TaxID=362257 RepID=UPI00343ED5FF